MADPKEVNKHLSVNSKITYVAPPIVLLPDSAGLEVQNNVKGHSLGNQGTLAEKAEPGRGVHDLK